MQHSSVKVVVLGNTGVGKSKLIHQFTHNQYDDQYEPTGLKGDTQHCSTIINGQVYHLKLLEMPLIKDFPADELCEWSQYGHCALRTAHAYIFMFDLNVPSSFYYVKGELNN